MCDVDVIVLQETVTATTRKWKLESCGERTVRQWHRLQCASFMEVRKYGISEAHVLGAAKKLSRVSQEPKNFCLKW